MMFPLDGVVADAAGQRMAGRVGVDLLCVLGPVSASGAETAALVPAAALAGPPAFDTMFNRTGMRIARASLRDHALVLRARGGFQSTDQVAVAQIDTRGDRWSIGLDIAHVENPNLEPAPRDLYVIVALEGDRPPGSIAVQFAGRQRDTRGVERPLADPVAPPLIVELF